MNLLENGSFRVYCTVYEYPQITCCYMIDFWTLPFLFCFVQFFFFFSFFDFFCSFCTIVLKKLDMVCCAWNLNIFNNETSFYEAKKQQKCHDILRMSHCILWCHFHCIWWINKWWKKMLMRFVDMAFIPRHSLSVCVCEQSNKQTWTASVNRTAEGKKINNNT